MQTYANHSFRYDHYEDRACDETQKSGPRRSQAHQPPPLTQADDKHSSHDRQRTPQPPLGMLKKR